MEEGQTGGHWMIIIQDFGLGPALTFCGGEQWEPMNSELTISKYVAYSLSDLPLPGLSWMGSDLTPLELTAQSSHWPWITCFVQRLLMVFMEALNLAWLFKPHFDSRERRMSLSRRILKLPTTHQPQLKNSIFHAIEAGQEWEDTSWHTYILTRRRRLASL